NFVECNACGVYTQVTSKYSFGNNWGIYTYSRRFLVVIYFEIQRFALGY
ncbi:MAG: hypothetical protein ACJA13_003721, partial [Paraglaciecola sp.]